MELLPIKRALLSVTDKSGLTALATFLHQNGVELVSTGGTQKALEKEGLKVTAVSEVTGFPEIMDGRVKTLHPHIHAGILADKDNPAHLATLREKNIQPFDLVCVNLYNFAGAIDRKLSVGEAIEEIDIGGPCMIRAASKNFSSVLVLSDPERYEEALEEMQAQNMHVTLKFRQRMAARSFETTSRYDSIIASYLR